MRRHLHDRSRAGSYGHGSEGPALPASSPPLPTHTLASIWRWLERDPTSVREARRFVDDACRGETDDDTLDTLLLLTSEVVTNAIVHARTQAAISVLIDHVAIRVEVTDGSPMPPRIETTPPEFGSGNGMFMVDQLAHSWGFERRPGGKAVWFCLHRR